LAVSILLFCLIISAETVDRIVAKVGREVILKSELEKRFFQLQAMEVAAKEMNMEDVLQDMIESELVLLTARESGIEVDEYAIKKLADQQIDELKKGYTDELQFRKELKEETNFTVKELKDYYVNMITEQRLREQVVSEKISSQVHVTDAEIEEYYNEQLIEKPQKKESDKIGMIMIGLQPGEKTRDKLKKQLYEIKDKLNKGEDFAELARKYSDCPSSKDGGDLGFIEKGVMVKPFEEAAFALEPGEISDLVETQFGYHLIYLQEKKEDQLKISHILLELKATENDISSTKAIAEDIRQRLEAGEDFGKLARENSQDESSAAQGGVIGEFPEEEYPELFKSYLDSLDYGEYTQVIEEGENLYIFGKLEKVPERVLTYKELYDQLKEKVYYLKQVEMYNNWIDELKKKTYIEIFL
jgi:peptidyl-prolyl cis-trans isomerase SurA